MQIYSDENIGNYTINNILNLINNLLDKLLSLDELSNQENLRLDNSKIEIFKALNFYTEDMDLSVGYAKDLDNEQIIQNACKQLKEIISQHHFSSFFFDLNNWHISFVLWRIHHGGLIHHLEGVVTSIAEIANLFNRQSDLLNILEIMNELTLAVVSEYYDDMSNTDPSRPWRILLINYAIVATRTHDIKEIETAYAFFVNHLPEDAAQFFFEAMKQMDAQNFPHQVKDVVEKFYQQYTVNQEYLKHVH
ncbi:MAG: hypothetical protein HQL46_05280 [Gammaproteobacteria bacterium]|nr:hypothetical protein [Gammaproteobacteria bacterium]